MISRGWKSFEVHNRKNPDYCEGDISSNLNIKGDSGKNLERRKESWRESFHFLREYINNYKQNVDRNINIKAYSGKVLDGNGEHILQNWRKDAPCKLTKKTWPNCVLVFGGR